jgi:carbonic anhydrase/acetyltransferase-like protein (isoleucine patch superfamily)
MRAALVRALVPVYLILIFGLPLLVPGFALWQAASRPALAVLLLLSPAIYALGLVTVAALLSRLTLFAIVPGRFPRDLAHAVYGPRRLYALCWTTVYYCGPLYHAILAVPWLRRATFRAFGYRGPLGFTTYPDTWLRDLPLLTIADGAYLANKATIGTNVCLRSGDVVVGPVEIGAGALVGHLAVIGPGSVLGPEAELGVGATLGMEVRIGRGARIGPCAGINHGAIIGDGAEIGAASTVGVRAVIDPGVRIPSQFAVPDRAHVRSADDVAGLRTVRRRSAHRLLGTMQMPSLPSSAPRQAWE